MRRGLVWTLGITVVLSLAAILTPQTPRVVAALEPQLREHAASLDLPATSLIVMPASEHISLPAKLPPLVLESAKRDIFAPDLPPVPKTAPKQEIAPAPALPPPPPRAPPLNLRYLGAMRTPEGQQLVYLARGDTAVAVAVGDRLDEGYLVESLSADAVVLVYPQLDQRVTVPIPRAHAQ
jgi:hypothetical protein